MTLDLGADFAAPSPSQAEAAPAYRVLARKYRPQTFAELVGQEALVRTLSNAFAAGRIAHAFILTGVRGVGKTSTARIVARGLNCIGADGTRTEPTVEPCGVCTHCTAIAADRHVDVLEIDAASHNGVAEIRELTDGARYSPASARFKVYILDEVHMLSGPSFNALLKTLEEPPAHVKFLLATTELRKVPVTVLSRCQRLTLRRVEPELLVAHFARILAKEGIAADQDAVALIARAADGSVRDGLSLLDQAIARAALAGGDGGRIDADTVRDMLGLADRGQIVDLFEAAMRGDAPGMLALNDRLHQAGADPAATIEDLLETTHLVTRLRAAPEAARAALPLESDRVRFGALAERLSLPALTRAWQVLLKGLAEVQTAPSPSQAAEMVLLRLAYAAELPSPADLVRRLIESEGTEATPQPTTAPRRPADPGPTASGPTGPVLAASGGLAVARALEPEHAPEPISPLPQPGSFREVVALFGERHEGMLRGFLHASTHLVSFEPGRIALRLAEGAPPTLPARAAALLGEWTGRRWIVNASPDQGEPTLAEQDRATRSRAFAEAEQDPTVRAILQHFPGAIITDVRTLETPTPETGGAEAGADTDVTPPDPEELS